MSTDPSLQSALAQGVQTVAATMDAESAKAVARPLAEAMGKTTDPNAPQAIARLDPGDNPNAPQPLAQALQAVAARMEPGEAARLLGEALGKNTDPAALQALAQGLLNVVATRAPGEVAQRNVLAARAFGELLSPATRLPGLATLAQATQTSHNPLTTQQLVDALKMPTCVGDARAVILALLGQRYGRAFADQWEFVEWAHEHQPDLDLTTPPKRPKQ
jgi:hypothetical protein